MRRGAAILFLMAWMCGAQQATLGRKGRQPERGPSAAGEAIRTLPRPGAPAR